MPPRWAARWLHAGRPDTSAGSRGAGEAPSPVTITRGAGPPGPDIPDDFAGLSFEVGPLNPGNAGVRGYLFSAENDSLVTLFRNVGLGNLRSLDLSGTRIADIAPLAALTALEFLDLTSTPVTDLTPLSALTNLRWLNMRNSSADTSPLSRLAGCHVITTTQAPRRRAQR